MSHECICGCIIHDATRCNCRGCMRAEIVLLRVAVDALTPLLEEVQAAHAYLDSRECPRGTAEHPLSLLSRLRRDVDIMGLADREFLAAVESRAKLPNARIRAAEVTRLFELAGDEAVFQSISGDSYVLKLGVARSLVAKARRRL